MIRELQRAADRFWFAPVSPLPLAALRIALIGYLLARRLPDEIGLLLYRSTWPGELFVPGVWLRWSPLPFPMGVELLPLFHTVMVLAGAAALAGVCTRPALLVFTVGYVYLKGVESAWGSFDHEPAVVVQILALLVLAPGVSACSIDRVIRWVRRRDRATGFTAAVVGRPVPRWGVQLVLIVLIVGYWGAGVAKLRHGGVEWLDGETLAFYMTGHSQSSRIQQIGSAADVPEERRWKDGFGLEFYLLGAQTSWLGELMARHPRAFPAAAAAALAIELLSPLILLGGACRTGLLLGAAGMHVVISTFMNISFVSWILIDLIMIDWAWLARGRPWRRLRIVGLRVAT